MSSPIYREEGACPVQKELDELNKIVDGLHKELGQHPLILAAFDAIRRLKLAATATVRISRGGRPESHITGYGIPKMEKAIACDQAIAIIKQIKALRAW